MNASAFGMLRGAIEPEKTSELDLQTHSRFRLLGVSGLVDFPQNSNPGRCCKIKDVTKLRIRRSGDDVSRHVSSRLGYKSEKLTCGTGSGNTELWRSWLWLTWWSLTA